MNIKYIQEEKNEVEIEIDNSTVIEILRVYLAKDEAVEFVAWKKEHPTKNPILKVKTSGKTAKKAIQEAIDKIEKDLDKVVSDFKKSVK